MAKELQADFLANKTLYYLLRSSVGQIWNGAAFENYATGNYATYPITGTEQGTASGYYTGDMPAVAAAVYNVVVKQQVGGSPAETDITVGTGSLQWDGTAAQGYPANFSSLSITLAGRVEIQSGFTKNSALSNFPFLMVKASDHVTPMTGLTITSQKSIDGGAFVGTTNTATEISNGLYKINLSAADMNGTNITFIFTAALADQRTVSITTTA